MIQTIRGIQLNHLFNLIHNCDDLNDFNEHIKYLLIVNKKRSIDRMLDDVYFFQDLYLKNVNVESSRLSFLK